MRKWILFVKFIEFTAFRLAKGPLDPKVLQRIASGLVKKAECHRLVAELGLSMADYQQFTAMKEAVDQLAPKVLIKWVNVNGRQANGFHLHAALVKIERQDLADSLVDMLRDSE